MPANHAGTEVRTLSENWNNNLTEFLESCRRGPRGTKYVIIGNRKQLDDVWPIMEAYAKRYGFPYVDTTRKAICSNTDVDIRAFNTRKLSFDLSFLTGINVREAFLLDCYDSEQVRKLKGTFPVWQPAIRQQELRFGL